MSFEQRRIPQLRRDHPCSTAFLDETGAISQDRFFAIGLMKTSKPARLLRAVQALRDERHWYEEIKFSRLRNKKTLMLYKELIDRCLDLPVEFFCFVADRNQADPIQRFGSQWDAYLKLAEQLVVASMHPDELLSLLADNYSAPAHVLFEENLRSAVNRRLNRLAVVTVVRLDSRSSDGLQLADLVTSALTLEFRIHAGLAQKESLKSELADHVRASLGATTCLGGWRNRHHSVQIYEHGGWAPPGT